MTQPTPEQRAEMAAYVDEHQPGLLDDLGISRTESPDSVETGEDIGGTTNAEAMTWWADAFPQWKGQ